MPVDVPDFSQQVVSMPVPVEFEAQVAGGSFAVLVSPTPGITITLHSIMCFTASKPANSQYRFWDQISGGNIVAPGPAAAGVPQNVDWKGANGAANGGVVIQNNGTVTGDFLVGVVVTS